MRLVNALSDFSVLLLGLVFVSKLSHERHDWSIANESFTFRVILLALLAELVLT